MARRGDLFATIRTEGGLLPSDVLSRIAQNDSGLAGLSPGDYHLNANERLGEMINRSWNRAMGAWIAFSEALDKLGPDDLATTVTRERWLLVLFDELGFGRLQPARAVEISGRQFPISHEWGGHVPLHLVGARVALDQRTAGVAGAARSSPHSLVQEFLNSSPDHLWGVVSNGLQLRLLRDNVAMTRQSYVEFDLAAMMAGQVYPDFVLLWLLLHESRFEGEQTADCWIEKWAKEAEAQGTRALDQLRDAVEIAITALGQGFLSNRANQPLREALRTGDLDKQDFYRQVLRLVYRLLFLFVAEDRDLLLDPKADPAARDHYLRFYSLDRLRRLAERRRGTLHSDLYQSLKVVTRALDEEGSDSLGLPALGSYLWSRTAVGDIDRAQISNRDFLACIYALAFHMSEGVRRPTDYRNLGSEELGSVYESLLELHPDLNLDAATFVLTTAPGHERKSTGSYYTPTSLIVSLLDTALDPVLEEAARKPDPEASILTLRVVDPACGSGHFLIAAAHRIAKRLATIKTGDDEPAPDAVRSSLRDVIGHCVYGVDVNEMAVELCKVSLWMEALEPGRPLSFLDHHILSGNSLLGTTPALLAEGLPDSAFKPIEGDDKAIASSLRKRNSQERGGQEWLPLEGDTTESVQPLGVMMASLESLPDSTVVAVREKERRYQELRRSPEALKAKLAADAWCAAFFAEKVPGAPAITQGIVRQAGTEPDRLSPAELALIEQFADDFAFHHWHIAFPEAFTRAGSASGPHGWTGGFDVVLGNPPWDKLEFQEKEWFAARSPVIAGAAGAKRKKLIAKAETEDPSLFASYRKAVRWAEAISHFLKNSGRYPLCGKGRLNTYAVFAEGMLSLVSTTGRAGIIVPTGIATDDTTKDFFSSIVDGSRLASLFDFANAAPIFLGVHRSYKFCLLTMAGASRLVTGGAEFAFFAHRVEDLLDPERRFRLSADAIALMNPNTKTCPIFRTRRDAELTMAIYRRLPILIRDGEPGGNPWGIQFRQGLFNMTSDSALFRTREELEGEGYALEGNVFATGHDRWLPLYEAKMVHHFDHRWASYQGETIVDVDVVAKRDPGTVVLPRYWVSETEVAARLPNRSSWLLGFRDITNTTNERTVIATIIPRAAVGNQLPLVFSDASPQRVALLAALLSSYVLDFVARQKVGGTHLNFYLAEQLPVLPPSTFDALAPWDPQVTLVDWLLPRVLELYYTATDLSGFAHDLGYGGPPFVWDTDRRLSLRAELDAAFFQLYGVGRADVEYMLETFPIVRGNDEKLYGEYRTKRLVLEAYDGMTRAMAN
jgi:hypothetical protein